MKEINNQGRSESNMKYSNIALIGVSMGFLFILLLATARYFLR